MLPLRPRPIAPSRQPVAIVPAQARVDHGSEPCMRSHRPTGHRGAALHRDAPGFELLVVLVRMGVLFRLINETIAMLGEQRLGGLGLGFVALAAVVTLDLVTLLLADTVTELGERHRAVSLARLAVLTAATAAADPSLLIVSAAAAAVGEAAVVDRVRGAVVASVALGGAFAVSVVQEPADAARLVAYYAESGLHVPVFTMPFAYMACAALIGIGIRRTYDGIERARAGERRALARKLHDRISNTISGIALLAEASRQAVVTNPGRAVLIAEEIREAAGAADREARTIMTDLRLVEAVNVRRAILDALDRATVARWATVTADIDPYLELPAMVVADLVAIAEESARNSTRHGQATRLGVSLHLHRRQATLVVADNGTGFDANVISRGYGIRGMAERVEERSGSLVVTSAPGEGCRVCATFSVT